MGIDTGKLEQMKLLPWPTVPPTIFPQLYVRIIKSRPSFLLLGLLYHLSPLCIFNLCLLALSSLKKKKSLTLTLPLVSSIFPLKANLHETIVSTSGVNP